MTVRRVVSIIAVLEIRGCNRNLVSQLIEHERIETTLPRAKELRRIADRVVTWAKEGTQHSWREAAAVVREEKQMHKLFTVFAERYRLREGGYTRILRTYQRLGDSAQMALIEYIDREGEMRPSKPPRRSLRPLAAQALPDTPQAPDSTA